MVCKLIDIEQYEEIIDADFEPFIIYCANDLAMLDLDVFDVMQDISQLSIRSDVEMAYEELHDIFTDFGKQKIRIDYEIVYWNPAAPKPKSIRIHLVDIHISCDNPW